MANYSAIKATVNAYIKQNGKKEITGRILNSVLNATIDSLGRFFQFAGEAIPTDDPGTPDQNVCYLAGEPGVYTNFGGITIENEEVALLFWNGEWTKQRILIGIQEVEVSVDNQVGTPSVDVSYSGGQLVLTFHNLKGETGDAAGFGTIGADINGGVGTPGVSVETSGSNTAKNIMFHFTNLKGETGVTSVVATIDDTSGTPSCQVSLVNGVLALAFSGLKGIKGDTGVSADYPIAIYNGLDSDATDQALAASQGKVLDGKISQLRQEIDGVVHMSFYQGGIGNSGSASGKYYSSQNRAATLNPITERVKVFVDSSDIYCQAIFRYLSNKSPMSEERLYPDTDYIFTELTAAQGRDFTIDIDETFPNVYLVFRKISSSANVPTDEVASALSVSVPNSIRKDISDMQLAISELSQEDEILSSDLNSLSEIVNGEQVGNLYLVQGGYGNGVPVSSTIRVRINRMLAKAEAHFDIVVPENANGIFYGICFYSILDDYTSFDHFTSYYLTNPKGMKITPEMIGDYAGITLIFSAPDRTSVITPDDIQGTQFLTENGVVQDLSELSEEVDLIAHSTKMMGNSDYYGKIVTLKMTDESHKLTSRLVCEHYNDEYPYTTKNQSMAIWDGKAFCFNDQNIGGFCVVIDVSSGDVLARIEDVPSVLSGDMAAHLNAASFTDQYYLAEDKYPLLLLSRGDYGSSDINKLCMYVFRITEPSENSFVFTRIKTINVRNVPLAIFNPSWDYDANRKMIWGHLHSQDWRWGQDGHRKFNNQLLYFAAPTGSQYVCVTSGGATAEVAATITIRIGTVIRNIDVNMGDAIEEVFPYSPSATGCSVISVNQSAAAYSGQYFVYSCDSDGNDRVEIKFACAIQGFKSPDLADPSDVTIGPDDMTNPSYIDSGIFQGGHCALGKLFLPFQNYKTINGQPTDYLGHCCLVVNPLSGYIESIIKTDSNENEGCAVWNGKLYISSHNGNAAGHQIGFRLIEYTFD